MRRNAQSAITSGGRIISCRKGRGAFTATKVPRNPAQGIRGRRNTSSPGRGWERRRISNSIKAERRGSRQDPLAIPRSTSPRAGVPLLFDGLSDSGSALVGRFRLTGPAELRL